VKPAKLQFSVNGPLVSTWRPTLLGDSSYGNLPLGRPCNLGEIQ